MAKSDSIITSEMTPDETVPTKAEPGEFAAEPEEERS